jgi:voltage-gated potassium channel
MYKFLQSAFFNPKTKIYFWVNDILAVVTIVSILTVVLETVSSLSDYKTWFLIVEWMAVVIFSAEYLGRLWVTKPKSKYVLSFYGVIDLVAILPTILGLGNLTFLKSARALRIIRLLRMLRLAKITRGGGNKDIEESFGVYGFNVLIYGLTLLFSLLVMGSLIYLVEPTTQTFSNIPAGMWWSFKVFMGSMPVVPPETELGSVVHVLTRFVGLLLLGLLVGTVGNIFRKLLLKGK